MPHKLGLCGPKKNCGKDFLAYIKGKSKNKKKIENFLKEFAAVNYYCQKYAKAKKIKNPFVAKILESYWLGGGHNYHVLHEKPFNKEIKMTKKLKELCQVKEGKIQIIKGFRLKVQGLRGWIIWKKDFIKRLEIGDRITHHWGVACERIS